MASFTAGTTFTDGVANDVTAAKLGVLVTNATPTSGFIQDRTAETVIASNDTVLIGDASDSNNLKRITVDNLMKADMTGNINSTSGTIQTLTSSTATITSGTFGGLFNGSLNTTTGTIGTFNSTTATIPTLTSTTLITTTGTIGTFNSTTATIPTLTSTTLITSGTGTASAPAIVPTGDTNNGLFFPAADNIAVSTNGTERVRVDSSGRVGIGTTSPSLTLDINAPLPSLGITATTGTERVFARATNTGGNFYFGIDSSTGGLFGGVAYARTLHSDGAYPIAIYTNATERLRIDSSGNVGIGASSLSDKLTVRGTTGVSTTIDMSSGISTGTEYGSLKFTASSPNFTGAEIRGIHTNGGTNLGVLAFHTSATERLRIDSSGNVGIGTTGAVNKLEIVGSFGRGAPVTKTGDFTLADTENWLIVNKGSSCTVTLPAASSWTGREFTIKVITAHTVVSASSNIVPRNSATAGTAILAATAGSWATLVSNGTNWVIMCGS